MLQIIAGSWPIAVMFIALLAALLVLRIIRFFNVARREDQAYRASQALTVRDAGHAILFALCTAALLAHAGSAIAADKPVPGPMMIGGAITGGGAAPVVHRKKRVETDEQYRRRVSKLARGKME